MSYLIILALFFLVIFISKGIIIVQQQEAVIIQRLGEYKETLGAGLHFILPIFEAPRPMLKIVKQRTLDGSIYSTQSYSTRIDLRETVYDFPRQNVITKDNVTISINALLYFQIIDAKRAIYSIENLPEAIEKLTQTNLRNLVGQLALDETLVSRDIINDKLREILDKATDKWGVKVNRVELQDIVPPASIQNAMEKEKKAEQDRRATILEAEGIKKSAVLTAEGEKLAAINKAEGEKQAEILKAEAEKQAEILKAEGSPLYPIIKLRRGKDEAVRRYHPWIFSGAIETAAPNLQAGDIVTVVDYKNDILGTGFAEAGNIAVKILAFENIKIDDNFWKERLEKAFELRKMMGLVDNEHTNCYRLVHSEGDNLPGLIIDIYGKTAVVQAQTEGMALNVKNIANSLLKIDGLIIDSVYQIRWYIGPR